MKQFPFVSPVIVRLVDGSHPDGHSDDNPQTISHLKFLFSRLTDPAMVEGCKEGIDALSLVATTRIELENQADVAESRGYWLLEDHRAEAIKRATKSPKNSYNMQVAHCILPFAEATLNMTTYKTVAPENKTHASEPNDGHPS